MWGLRRRRDEAGDAEVRERFARVVGGGWHDAPVPERETGPPHVSPAGYGSEPAHVSPATEPEPEPPPSPAPDAAAQALAAFDPGRRGVRALAALAVVVLAVAGFLAWRARPAPSPVPARPSVDLPGASPTSGVVIVAVAGKVQRPGLVRLPVGSRVQDAINAAGGPLAGVDLSYVNLARKLVDGELVLVGVAPPAGAADGGGAPAAGGGLVNLNTATLTQLQELPGVGPVLAQRIIDHRTRKGAFGAVSELRQVDGIGDARYAQLKDLVTV